jgi:hypothetical protein
LAKILICKGCGRYFTGQYRFDIDGGSRSAYRCSYTRGVRSCNNEKSISMRLIDSTIWSFIKSDISTLWNFIINNNQNKKDYDSQIKNLENLIQENLNILTRLNKRYQSMVYLNEEQEYILIYKLPNHFYDDYDKILKGMYSKTSGSYKDIICKIYGTGRIYNEHYPSVYDCLEPTKEKRKLYADFLGVDISEIKEVSSIPDPNYEIYKTIKQLKE